MFKKPPHYQQTRPAEQPEQDYRVTLLNSFKIPVMVAAGFWAVEVLEYLFEINMNFLGIYPRRFSGLAGILTAPFLHAGFTHLLSNTTTFIILGSSILFFYPRISISVWLYIYLLTGAGVWLFGRASYHVGASGMLYGFAAFLFFSGIFRKDLRSMVISLATAFLYGGMLYGIFPNHPGVSWESHLIGALVGAWTAFNFRHYASGDEPQQVYYEEDPHFEGYRNIEDRRIKYIYFEEGGEEKEADARN